jgi:hypothetical protein
MKTKANTFVFWDEIWIFLKPIKINIKDHYV